MPKQIVTSQSAPSTGCGDPAKPPPIVQAIRWCNMLFVSGQGPLDPQTKTVVEGDIEVQVRRTLANLETILREADAAFANVVNMRAVLREVADFPPLQRCVPGRAQRRESHAYLRGRHAAPQGRQRRDRLRCHVRLTPRVRSVNL